jgi:hypothetical protein
MYSEDEIKKAVEKIERRRVKEEISLLEQKEGFVQEHDSILDKHRFSLEVIGAVTTGIAASILSLILNYLIFTKFLHVEF